MASSMVANPPRSPCIRSLSLRLPARSPLLARSLARTCRSRPSPGSRGRPGRRRPQRRHRQRVRDHRDLEARSSSSAATVRLTPSTATEPFGIRSGPRPAVLPSTSSRAPSPLRPDGRHPADPVHVSQHQMAAEPPVEPERPLEIHRVARRRARPRASRASVSGPRSKASRPGLALHHGEADAVDRHARAELEPPRGLVRHDDSQPPPASDASPPPHAAQLLDDPGEHGLAQDVGLDQQVVAERRVVTSTSGTLP